MSNEDTPSGDNANISEKQAQITALSVITAMIENDKPGREALYDGYSAEDMKRVLRWTIRFMGPSFIALHPKEVLAEALLNLAMEPGE